MFALVNTQSNIMWQDYVLTLCNILLNGSFFFTVINQWRIKTCSIPYKTSVTSAFTLLVIASTNYTLGLRWSVAMITMGSFLWLITILQRWLYNKD